MLAACGITAWWARPLATHAAEASGDEGPLTAQLKTEPEDFVVVEIDPAGQRTDASTYSFAEAAALASSTDAPARAVKDAEEVAEQHAGLPTESREGLTTERLSALLASLDAQLVRSHATVEEVADRSASLSPEELRALVVESIRTSVGASENRNSVASADAAPSRTAQERWWDQSFALAADAQKAQRRLLHLAVRQHYAHVRTVGMAKSAGDDRPCGGDVAEEVRASLDPLFIFFTFLFGESVAHTLALWSQRKAAATAAGKLSEEEMTTLASLQTEQERACPLRSRTREVPTTIHTSFPPAARVAGVACLTSSSTDCLSEKDVRRAFHEVMRRFFGFVRCSVRDGNITLSFKPPPPLSSSPTPAAHLSREEGELQGHGVDDDGGDKSCGRKRAREWASEAEREGVTTKGPREDTAGTVGEKPCFLHCIVRKRNLDTIEMKALLAAALSVKEGSVCMAGMKDKRAVTYQRVSVPWTASRLPPNLSVNGEGQRIPWPSDPRGSYLNIVKCAADPAFRKPIQLGELEGNAFTITLRHIQFSEESAAARDVAATLQARFTHTVDNGFINYFGQQRFSESVTSLQDHTGLHLFAGRHVAAVKSVFRASPEVYDGFPDKMDARHVPRNSRDCATVAHALRQTYRMYFSEHALTRDDVRQESPLWQRVCEKAMCESLPFTLRSLLVHAGQSLFFNVAASFAAEALTTASQRGERSVEETRRLASLLTLPMAGYHVSRGSGGSTGADAALKERQRVCERLADAAEAHALHVLGLSRAAVFERRRVAGVPTPGTRRRVFVRPRDAVLHIDSAGSAGAVLPQAVVSFHLPSSSYATVFLREVLGTDERW